jgi:hypothetical protein
LVVRGWGDPISDEGTGTLVLYVYFNPSTGRLDNFWYPLDNPTQPLARGRVERGGGRGVQECRFVGGASVGRGRSSVTSIK